MNAAEAIAMDLASRPAKRMDPEVKAKWLNALRSGRYTQAKKTLRSPLGHCCIGVLATVCEPILRTAGFDVKSYPESRSMSVQGNRNTLSLGAARVFGLGDVYMRDLMYINDAQETKDYSRQIDYIERYL